MGKDAVARGLIKKNKNIEKVITCTSRQRRPKEINGRDYYFISPDEFKKRIKRDYFLEYAQVHNHYYGTPKEEVERILKKGNYPVLVIDIQGGLAVKKILSPEERLMIFLLAESKEQLKVRIARRKAKMNQKDLKIRMENADKELKVADEYDEQVVNREGKLDETVEKVMEIINK